MAMLLGRIRSIFSHRKVEADTAQSLLRLKGVRLQLGNKTVLDDLNLTVARGEIHGLLGANGSGKSSLAYAIMGCEGYRPDAGEMFFEDRRIDSLPLHQRARLGITLAWQEPARFEGLTIGDYLRIGGQATNVADCLRRVGLDPREYATRLVDKALSGGERKRVELAAISAMRPKLAILDEPTAGIDLLSLDALMAVIETLKAAGSSVLLITHQAAVAAHAARASQLCGGRIVYQGATLKVLEHYRGRACHDCDGRTCGHG
jgi:Fe-S cluster assembly ATP-binding protein